MSGKARFSARVMECKLEGKVSEGMFQVVQDHLEKENITYASYLRELIMKDRKIDEYGNPTRKN